MLRTVAACLLLGTAPVAALAEMTISFQWGNIPLCTSGSPNVVDNPVFGLRGVPAGTQTVEFLLRDLDVPSYDHGGGRLGITRDMDVPGGSFSYESPCPPDGVHTYEWTATARAGGQVLATARARRRYPE